jgi:putative ABC transport system substrate-binding protein
MIARRAFLSLLGAAAWPIESRAQQPGMPVIGFLNPSSPDGLGAGLRAFRQGLGATGYTEGENVAIIYRWAEGRFEQLPALAADLVRRRVALIVSTGSPNAHLAAKATTSTIPIVFNTAEDPVRTGLVASISRPGGNLTGVNFLGIELSGKRFELLHQMLPAARRIAVLVIPERRHPYCATWKQPQRRSNWKFRS